MYVAQNCSSYRFFFFSQSHRPSLRFLSPFPVGVFVALFVCIFFVLLSQTIITFYNCTQKAIADSPADAKVTWAHIKTTMSPLLQKVRHEDTTIV